MFRNPEKALDDYEKKMPFNHIEYLLKQPENRIDINDPDFENVYSKEEIQRDKDLVENIKNDFGDFKNTPEIQRSRDKQQQAKALEVILAEDAHVLGWFENEEIESNAIRTSEYDDYINGVDSVFEFIKEDGDEVRRVALAIDISENPNFDKISKKVDRNLQKVLNPRKQMQIKYFKSTMEDKVGRLRNIIPLVIGLRGDNVNKIIPEIADLRNSGEKGNIEEIKEKKESLENSPFQKILLEEMKAQLEYYQDNLDEMDETDYIRKYKEEIVNAKEIIEDLIESKRDIPGSWDGYQDQLNKILGKKEPGFVTED